jgi:hypothetical protein
VSTYPITYPVTRAVTYAPSRALLGRAGTGGGGFTITTYLEDHFNNTGGANVSLVGWVPDTKGNVAWSKNTVSPTDNAQVAFATDNVIGTDATGSYYVNKSTLPVSDYQISANLADTFGASVLARFSDTALTGYQVFRDSTNTSATYGFTLRRGNAGSFTNIGAIGAFPSNNVVLSTWVMSDRVRFKLQDFTTGGTVIVDDVSGSQVTAQNFPGLSVRTTAEVDDFVVTNVPPVARGGSQLTANGIWTWFNDPRAITVNGKTYFSYVTAAGSIMLARLDGGIVVTEVVVSSALEQDDHDNGGLIVLPGGRIAVFYSKHSSDTVGMRYRVSTNPLPDISSFNAEVQISNGGVDSTAYAKPYYFADDNKIRLYYRSATTTTRPQKVAIADATLIEAGTATWSTNSVLNIANNRPYVLMVQNVANRVDFFMTNGHPNEVATSIYHMYMTVSGGVESYFTTDGTPIAGGLPIDPSTSATLIDGTTGGRSWNWSIGIGADGFPRVLYAKYPSSTGARDVFFTDVQYWHGRWNGSAWVKTQLNSGQHSLYANENHYLGGMAFDANDVTTFVLSEWNSTNAVNRLVEYSFNESTGVKTQTRIIADDPSSHQLRPYSPRNHGDDCKWVWAEGGYVCYGVGSAQASTVPTPPAFPPYNTTLRYATKQGYTPPAYSFINAEAAAVAAAFTTPPVDTRKILMDNLVSELKSAGIWSLLDVFYILAAADSQAGTINWITPASFTLIPVNSPGFLADRGYIGNGTTSRLRTQFIPSTNGTKGTLNDYSLSEFSLTQLDAANQADFGSVTAPRSFINPLSGGFASWSVNDAGGGTNPASASSIGLFQAQRTDSTATRLRRNGVQIGADRAVTSTAIASQEQWICGADATNFSARRIAMAAWGAGLAGKEVSFYNIVNEYLHAIGAT